VPKAIAKNKKFPHWFSSELKALIFEKKKAHKKYKLTNSLEDYTVFSDLRESCKTLYELTYSAHISDIEGRLCSDSKNFWNYVNNKNKKGCFPSSMVYDDTWAKNSSDIVELFRQHFSSVYCNKSCPPQTHNYERTTDLSSLHITPLEVFNAISCMNNRLGVGPDGVPPCFIKSCQCILSTILSKIFNISLSTGFS